MKNILTAYQRVYIKNVLSKLMFWKRRRIFDLAFVITEDSKGWILEAICREIATYFKGTYCFAHDLQNLPPAKAYYYAHYSYFPTCLQHNPHVLGSKHFPFHTHPKDIGLSQQEFNSVFNKATKVVCMNSTFAQQLVKEGLNKNKVTYIICGADKEMFLPHTRGGGLVGFSTAFYERKDPDKILNIVTSMPNRNFLLIGKNWEKYSRFNELLSQPNFKFVTATYNEYPGYYRMMDVFVSPAVLEGGPIPLIESMMSNVVPVASKTGFAPDIIKDGENGYIFDVDASVEEICLLIDKAFNCKADIRSSVEHLTWENFSKNFQRLL